MSSSSEQTVAEKLLQAGAVKLNVAQPFTWASGWKSPIYCDNRKLLSFPFIRDFIKSELCNVIFEKYPDAAAIAGVATAGIPWGAMVADQLKLPFAYVRSKAKDHGLGNKIEGSLAAGQPVIMVEDLISTGISSLDAARSLLTENVPVTAVVSIFNYGFEKAVNAFNEAEIPFLSLTNYTALIDLAIQKGMVKESEKEVLMQWRINPGEWGK